MVNYSHVKKQFAFYFIYNVSMAIGSYRFTHNVSKDNHLNREYKTSVEFQVCALFSPLLMILIGTLTKRSEQNLSPVTTVHYFSLRMSRNTSR